MSQDFVIEAFPRDDQGKGASRRLRREERKIPAIIYGGGKDATPVAIWHNELKKAIENEAFFSHILTIELGGKKESVILKDLQRHPAKNLIWHADFQRVSKSSKITTTVPLHFLNEESCKGVKLGGGKIMHQMNTLEIVCAAGDLPEYIEIDMADVEVGGVIHLSDLKLPKGVESLALSHGEEHDTSVVSVIEPKGSKEDEAEDAEAEGGDE